jgi:hypothetical protein
MSEEYREIANHHFPLWQRDVAKEVILSKRSDYSKKNSYPIQKKKEYSNFLRMHCTLAHVGFAKWWNSTCSIFVCSIPVVPSRGITARFDTGTLGHTNWGSYIFRHLGDSVPSPKATPTHRGSVLTDGNLRISSFRHLRKRDLTGIPD